MLSSPSLCSLCPSTIHACQLNGEHRDERSERWQSSDDDCRRFYGSIDMPLNSSRLPLNPDHIATQIREQSCRNEREELTPAMPTQPLRRTARAMRRPMATARTQTPPAVDMPALHSSLSRRSTAATTRLRENDTRRHGMILAEACIPPPDDLPSYSTVAYTRFRRVTEDGRPSSSLDPRTAHGWQSRQRELRELQRQWNVRRHRQASWETERTHFRALVSEAYDLPPPYAARDPYPIFKAEEKKPSIWSRVVLYPFVPEGERLTKAAFATDRIAAKAAFGVKKKVEEVGKKAKAVPGKIEKQRATRKMRWLAERGFVGSGQEGVECSEYAGAYHVM